VTDESVLESDTSLKVYLVSFQNRSISRTENQLTTSRPLALLPLRDFKNQAATTQSHARAVDGYPAGEDQTSTVVEPKPRATGLTFDEIVADHLDYLHHEAFFVVSPTFEVTAYRTLWFGLQYDAVLLQP
jgi:hypothetical protein